MESFWLSFFSPPPCGLYGFAFEEQMFFKNTNLDFLDKRYPFKDIKKSMQIRSHVLPNKAKYKRIPHEHERTINHNKSIFIRKIGITH